MGIYEAIARITPAFMQSLMVHTDIADLDIADFGARFINSKYGRPYRHKSRKALTNYRSGNQKKLHQY